MPYVFTFLGLAVHEIDFYFVYVIYFISHSFEVVMLFQLDFKGPYHSIRMRLEIALVVCDLHDLLIHFSYFSV